MKRCQILKLLLLYYNTLGYKIAKLLIPLLEPLTHNEFTDQGFLQFC